MEREGGAGRGKGGAMGCEEEREGGLERGPGGGGRGHRGAAGLLDHSLLGKCRSAACAL